MVMAKRLISYIALSLLFVFFGLSFFGCKKINSFSDGNLDFSADTIVFDTVFTTIGSTTKQLKLYNPASRTLQVSEVELMGREDSPFRINLDGISADYFENIEIEGKDSLFMFIEVTLQVNGAILPMIIEDSIRFRTNGKDQYVQLAVWGQDAYFHYSNFQTNEFDLNEGTWPNDKPHVIYGAAVVDSAKTLTIPAGTQIHMHKNALLYVYKGSLHIEGTLNNEVEIKGDRLEMDYQNVTGQYYGLYFHQAQASSIEYAIIKNGISGIHLYSTDINNVGYTLTLRNSIIQNHARYGVFLYSGAKVKAENCIIHKNGFHSLLVLEGGDFNFNHCHLLGYGGASTPAVGISNFYTDYSNATLNIGSINEGKITNSVIHGNLQNEFVLDTIYDPMVNLSFDMQNNLFKLEDIPAESFFQNMYWNTNPDFTDIQLSDYTYPSTSILNSNGIVSSLFTDILGNPRNNPPDIGAFEVN